MSEKNAFLRPFHEGDSELVLRWRNAPEVRKNMYSTHEISSFEHEAWFKETLVSATRCYFICEIEQEPVGVVGFYNIDKQNRTAEWAFYSGDTSRRGAGSVMEWLALEIAFGELDLFKLNCEVLSSNYSVVRFHRKFGFRVEGVCRAEKERDNGREDVYKLAMFGSDWHKFLRQFNESRIFGDKQSLSWLPGQTFEKALIFSREEIHDFARVSGDKNPLHIDEDFARSAGFPAVIAHGALILARISETLGMEFPGQGTVYIGQSATFLSPCFAGVEYQLSLNIASVIGNRAFLEVEVHADGRSNFKGEAEVRLPQKRSKE